MCPPKYEEIIEVCLRAYWKSSDWRAFGTIYAPIVMVDYLTRKYYQPLSATINILLGHTRSANELHIAELMPVKFVADVTDLYGKQHKTYNFHILLHYTRAVINYPGPLLHPYSRMSTDTYSSYFME